MSEAEAKLEFVVPATGKEVRTRLLQRTPRFKQERVTISIDDETLDVVVREPTLADRTAMFKAAGMKSRGGEMDIGDTAKLQVWATILCTFSLTGERVFSGDAEEALLNMPTGSFVEKISAKVTELMNSASVAGKA